MLWFDFDYALGKFFSFTCVAYPSTPQVILINVPSLLQGVVPWEHETRPVWKIEWWWVKRALYLESFNSSLVEKFPEARNIS